MPLESLLYVLLVLMAEKSSFKMKSVGHSGITYVMLLAYACVCGMLPLIMDVEFLGHLLDFDPSMH